MPQIIQAYGREYEFPDGMSDDAIRAALLKDAPTSVAGKAAARLPRMAAEATAAQNDVKNDTIGRGVGQALGSAAFALPAEAVAQEDRHPILTAATGGLYPIVASLLPGMVKSAKNQVVQAGNDVRTAATGNQGPNLPAASLPERGRAAVRVPVRLLSAALAPAGVAGVADAADAIGTDPNPLTATGRAFTGAALTGGAIPVGRLAAESTKAAGPALEASAVKQVADLFQRTPKNSAMIDQVAPQLVDKRVTFSTADDLAARANAEAAKLNVPVRGPKGRMVKAPGRQDWQNAAALAPDVVPSQTPGQIIGQAARDGAGALAEGTAGYLARKAGLPIGGEVGMAHAGLKLGRIGVSSLRELANSPAINTFSAAQKARLADVLSSGGPGAATGGAATLSAIGGANDPQAKYLQTLMRGGAMPPTAKGGDTIGEMLFGGSANAQELPQQPRPSAPRATMPLPEASATTGVNGRLSLGNDDPIQRAKYELAHYGVTSEQSNAYRPGVSEALRRAVDPIDEYDSTGFMKDAARRAIPQLLGQNLDKRDPQLDDAWRLYLGMPQRHGSFEISDYKPSVTKGGADAEPYYYKIKGWFRNFFDQSLGDGAKSDADVMRSLVSDINDSEGGRSHLDGDKTMREYTMMRGQDARGPYISVFDRWDLAPALSNTKTMNLDKVVGRPFEIYDRLYYDPKTFEPKFGDNPK